MKGNVIACPEEELPGTTLETQIRNSKQLLNSSLCQIPNADIRSKEAQSAGLTIKPKLQRLPLIRLLVKHMFATAPM